MERPDILALIHALAEALTTGDLSRYTTFFTEDARFRLIGNPYHNPFSGLHIGRQEIRDTMRMIAPEFAYLDYAVDRVLIDGNQTAVRWHSRLRNRGTGAEAEVSGFQHLVFRASLICEFTDFFDTATVAALAERI